jgi:hypothetical protein
MGTPFTQVSTQRLEERLKWHSTRMVDTVLLPMRMSVASTISDLPATCNSIILETEMMATTTIPTVKSKNGGNLLKKLV